MSVRGGPLVVVGDALLDVDVEGVVERLCPDAPVPVLEHASEVVGPGGAGLAAALAARDGAEVLLLAALPDDPEARRVAGLLERAGVQLVRVPAEGATPVKRRLRAGGRSLLRWDQGSPGAVHPPTDAALRALMGAGAVLVADYGRGTADEPTLRRALASLARTVPMVWDPHARGAAPVPGVRIAVPNQREAAAFAEVHGAHAGASTGTPAVASGLPQASAHATRLVEAWGATAVAVTLGPGGALVSHGGSSPSLVPAPRVEAGDPCGAGDRLAAAAVLALAGGAVTLEAVHEGVLAASAFVAAGGASGFRASGARELVPPAGDEVLDRVRSHGGTVVATGGCFDLLHAGHVATLEAARALGDCLVVCLNSDASVRRLKGDARPLVPQDDRARVLLALEPVDSVVVFDEDTPVEVLRRLRPDVWVKGGDYAGADLPEAALLREWGGQSVVVPYVAGRSTTRLVEAAAGRWGAGA